MKKTKKQIRQRSAYLVFEHWHFRRGCAGHPYRCQTLGYASAILGLLSIAGGPLSLYFALLSVILTLLSIRT